MPHPTEYRLRVGDYRVLFEVADDKVIGYRIVQPQRGILTFLGKIMLKLHPEILVKNCKKEFVILLYEEFLALQEQLADAQDLMDLRKAKRAARRKKSIPFAKVKAELGID